MLTAEDERYPRLLAEPVGAERVSRPRLGSLLERSRSVPPQQVSARQYKMLDVPTRVFISIVDRMVGRVGAGRNRRCPTCSTTPSVRLIPRLEGQCGGTRITLTQFPIRRCDCGATRTWAFEPDLELSNQLFRAGVFRGRRAGSTSECGRCRSARVEPANVALVSEGRLAGFAISLSICTSGLVCSACGARQLVPDALRINRRGSGSEIISAFNLALADAGIAPYY